jgi:hypothetical protein
MQAYEINFLKEADHSSRKVFQLCSYSFLYVVHRNFYLNRALACKSLITCWLNVIEEKKNVCYKCKNIMSIAVNREWINWRKSFQMEH